MDKQILQELLELFPVLYYKQVGERYAIAIRLAYHVAVYTQPVGTDYDDRYCIADLETATQAIDEYCETGEMRYWQKHANKRLRCVGNGVYPESELVCEKNLLYRVDWNATEIAAHNRYNCAMLKTILPESEITL